MRQVRRTVETAAEHRLGVSVQGQRILYHRLPEQELSGSQEERPAQRRLIQCFLPHSEENVSGGGVSSRRMRRSCSSFRLFLKVRISPLGILTSWRIFASISSSPGCWSRRSARRADG